MQHTMGVSKMKICALVLACLVAIQGFPAENADDEVDLFINGTTDTSANDTTIKPPQTSATEHTTTAQPTSDHTTGKSSEPTTHHETTEHTTHQETTDHTTHPMTPTATTAPTSHPMTLTTPGKTTSTSGATTTAKPKRGFDGGSFGGGVGLGLGIAFLLLVVYKCYGNYRNKNHGYSRTK